MIESASGMLFCILLVTGDVLWKYQNGMDHPTEEPERRH